MRQLFVSPIPIWMVFAKLDSMQHLETNVIGVGTTAVVRVFREFLLVEQSHLTQIRLTLHTMVLLNLIMMMELFLLEQSSRIQILESSVGVRLILVQDLLLRFTIFW